MKKTYLIAILGIALAIGETLYAFPEIRDKIPFLRPAPEYAASYSIINAFCSNNDSHCRTIQFTFSPSEKSQKLVPPYEVRQINEEARLQIVFHKISEVNTAFTYLEVTNSDFIDNLDYYQTGEDFVLNIARKGELESPEITQVGDAVKIVLASSDAKTSPFSSYKPAENSSVYPTKQTIGVDVALENPLEKAVMYVQDNPVEAKVADLGSNRFSISYAAMLENDQQYTVKVIVTDSKKQTAAATWEFASQKTILAVQLKQDRFKYLGWWGDINSDTTGVFAGPTTQSKKLGMFSTINRVKVLEEVSGEPSGKNNLWYKIDGGVYPGAYVFSGDVTSIIQPEPPAQFTIPGIVNPGEYWVDTDLTKKILTLFLYDQPVFATYISPGIAYSPSPVGTYRIWYKLLKTRMRGRPPVVSHPYDLPNVPYTMFYYGSFSLHGTYWHDKFGTRQSSGCTNLTQGDAKYIFDLVNPKIPEGKTSVLSSSDNPGTVVYNHY